MSASIYRGRLDGAVGNQTSVEEAARRESAGGEEGTAARKGCEAGSIKLDKREGKGRCWPAVEPKGQDVQVT